MTASGKATRTEPWRQRLIRGLLYGRNVDRGTKARARVGLAIIAFAAIYAVIGGRLVMFAVGADGHSARQAAAPTVSHLMANSERVWRRSSAGRATDF